ncbi:MAG TPA: 4,5-DOPA dioxygenase extradiol [Acidimicrobiales bacterium]|nr:4,5-DOPA dioxygenase extradiol [Acidimicrobiales bacterium]
MSDTTQPALFIGHGNPMNAIESNVYSDAWRALGASLPRPRAVLSISAHWYVRTTMVTAMDNPRTIHDFGGFPAELFAVEYPAAGSAALAGEVRDLLRPNRVGLDESWGLDHGTWSVLVHMFPDADVPVVQLSIDRSKPAAFHYALGQALAPLSDAGVLIVGSGNVVHNLETYAWGGHPTGAFDWALRFDGQVRRLLEAGDHQPLVDYEQLGPDARLATPTPDHYLPLLYTIGAGGGRSVSYPVTGIEGGSISMLAVRLD